MRRTHRLAARLGLLGALMLLAGTASARASTTQTSVMQDDQMLIDASSPTVATTLARMQQLGVETVRVNLQWATVAPDPTSRTAPTAFAAGDAAAADPAAYPAAGFSPYDRLVELAPLFGISVQLNLTGPGPLWAMAAGSPTARASTHWKPNARMFGSFVSAVAQRYSGKDGLPRVTQWSIWNEPNQPGWLAPQWQTVKKKSVAQSPRLYRNLLDAAYGALIRAGHSPRSDTILIGETAPEGDDTGGFYTAMTPIPFLRDLYCVSTRDKPLRGAAASAVGCPSKGSAASFRKAHPGLFNATGYAHHPYDFFKTPTYSWTDADKVPLVDISRLERFLNTTFRAYGSSRKIPLYFTEYGYETNPPDPHQVVSPAEQAAYLNEADYMSWANPRIHSVAQFLLYDSAPDIRYPTGPKHWDTFQTGLLFLSGRPKPSYSAYRMPIWIPTTHVTRRGTSVLVWGQVRPADRRGSQTVKVQFKTKGRRGSWRTVATVHTRAQTGYFTTHIRVTASGSVRSVWRGTVGYAASDDALAGTFTSRSVGVVLAPRSTRRAAVASRMSALRG